MQRRLAAILAVDVVGYSRLMGRDEAGTLLALKSLRQDTLQPLLVKHSGRIVKLMGDGVLVEFASAVDAVQCAVELQAAMAAANANAPEDSRILLRVGINLGDMIVEGDDLYGDGVNIAARLEALAEPGGVVGSRSMTWASSSSRTLPSRSASTGCGRTAKGRSRSQHWRCLTGRRSLFCPSRT